MFKFGLVVLALMSAGSAAARAGTFVVDVPGTLTVSRMDPIANPAGLNTPEEQLAAECTTVQIGDDKSNYWAPSLYWINANGTYTLLPHALKIYYLFQTGVQKTHAFPPGLRMISGIAMRRDPGHIAAQGFDINMSPYNADIPYNHQYLPNGTTYPDPPPGNYIHMNIGFPFCGRADQALDSDGHFSHMSWGIDGGGNWEPNNHIGKCPESHPILYPRIFLENFYYITPEMKAQWNKSGPNFILSNGDTTGVTFHADFVNGWKTETLQAAVEECFDTGHDIGSCAPFVPTLNATENERQCRYQGQIPAEDVGFSGPIEHLPGCNPRWDWDGPMSKPNSPADCPWFKQPGWTSPNLMFRIPQYEGTGSVTNNIPVVLPGVDTSNLTNLPSPIGSSPNKPVPKYIEWAVRTDETTKVPHVMVGTQEAVDAAAMSPSGLNADCQVYGRGRIGKGFTARDPGENGLKNVDTTGSGGLFKETYRCSTPIYLPCGPPDNSTLSGGISTQPGANSTLREANSTQAESSAGNATAPIGSASPPERSASSSEEVQPVAGSPTDLGNVLVGAPSDEVTGSSSASAGPSADTDPSSALADPSAATTGPSDVPKRCGRKRRRSH
ncbi:hypothetical protein CcaverHIS002_0212130 [Cutaneotrichosporon cavernicola]|uniref:DUF1996 domain-containing protein n=1 Tax=Cutaneotrichosporon cavernicola TaxID=279322 RepID=A0AA48IBN6_9TREE|nr:uncharacterized protein CcaverHIS019_0212140 [Cutaneotrichosporon cavernicola]BEI82053.1 hypothetical protein CcaverHIS002_0212130 [Cutaneotrichosporon cavernicola]BEI89852.1 hypothetical protein CcaverHIS019_0212140 [Cutaneotrichosporon cavernicola]BEI97622.1 hypothetical protein CcaverHIS631_0212110 [Cutaneotrichosporon cavernicola]BEJ05401.1 hypothetical protein CcaverHIS641_0212180 [Cutaneotrichosporon cavernicola]